MNAEEFLKYLNDHNGEAWVKNPETLKVAKEMESQGLLLESGRKQTGELFYQLTPKGTGFVAYSLKRLPGTKGDSLKRGLKWLGGAVQDYAQAFKAENPVGVFGEMRKLSKMANDYGGTELPNIEPMRLDVPRQKALPAKKAKRKSEEYVKIDGKLFRKVDDE